jgi:hypothetical protein
MPAIRHSTITGRFVLEVDAPKAARVSNLHFVHLQVLCYVLQHISLTAVF